MTREEAINEIKSWAIPSEKGREVLETLIPELAESEDESLKNKSGYYKAGKFWKASTLWNATKNKIPQRVSNRYILQECTWNIGNLQDFANEVKNVQEVSLDYPIILDMNGNIIDGAHRVVKAYLEGKDIDIVYIGDDEWPEPDYDEEKAVKESEDERIRKFLIQHISEWIGCIEHDLKNSSKDIESEKELVMFKAGLAYLEKQKETSHISEMCKENANSFADGIIEVRSFQRGMEEGRRLEKQKEQKHNYCLYGGYPSVGRCRWCYAACSARLADVHTDEEKEYIRTIKSIISDFIRDKKPENLAYYQKIYDWLDGRYVPFS